MESVPTTSGASLLPLQTYAKLHLGDSGWDQILAIMPAQQALELRGIILPQRWYPTEAFVAALEVVGAKLGTEKFFETYGEWAARYKINAFFRFLLRFTSPNWVVTRGMKIWRSLHSHGEWQVELDDHHFRGTLSNFGVVNPSYCRVVVGWIRGAGRTTGLDDPQTSHPECRAHGFPACLFVAEW